jgi:hypothetical protein
VHTSRDGVDVWHLDLLAVSFAIEAFVKVLAHKLLHHERAGIHDGPVRDYGLVSAQSRAARRSLPTCSPPHTGVDETIFMDTDGFVMKPISSNLAIVWVPEQI